MFTLQANTMRRMRKTMIMTTKWIYICKTYVFLAYLITQTRTEKINCSVQISGAFNCSHVTISKKEIKKACFRGIRFLLLNRNKTKTKTETNYLTLLYSTSEYEQPKDTNVNMNVGEKKLLMLHVSCYD